jgi:diadenosine tetraphosphatase ApaH/serine/threonine PP2A family protein phosphatase
VPVVFEKRGMSPAVRMEPMGFQLSFGRKYFINVGSVGPPRDGNPKPSYCLYDTSTRSVEFRRLDYDIAEAQALIRAAHLPERLALRLEVGR